LMDSNNSKSSKANGPREKTIVRLFEDQAARTPDDIAAVSGDLRLTYRELDVRSNRLARYLQSAGVGAESLVGLAVDRSHEMLIAMLAILKSGGAYVPIDPSYPSARIALVIEDSQLGFILTTEQLRATLPATPARIISWTATPKRLPRRVPTPCLLPPPGIVSLTSCTHRARPASQRA
jgi:non-ribosomal peptide synthetase component F